MTFELFGIFPLVAWLSFLTWHAGTSQFKSLSYCDKIFFKLSQR